MWCFLLSARKERWRMPLNVVAASGDKNSRRLYDDVQIAFRAIFTLLTTARLTTRAV